MALAVSTFCARMVEAGDLNLHNMGAHNLTVFQACQERDATFHSLSIPHHNLHLVECVQVLASPLGIQRGPNTFCTTSVRI